KEQSRGTESEINHREQTTLETLVVECEKADHDEAQVTDAAVGQQAAKIRLNQRHNRAVQNGSQTQRHNNGDDHLALRSLWEQGNAESYEAERAQFQSGQHDGHPDRAFE